jgi:putative ABC transport system substrate-binding protein
VQISGTTSEETARTLGLEVIALQIHRSEDIAPAIAALRSRVDALYFATDPLLFVNRIGTNALAMEARLPTIYGSREYVEAGGLMSYGASFVNLFRRGGDYVDKILRGAKTCRPAGGAADDIRIGDQSQNRESA